MRVAVTGASGLLGRATVPLLAAQGHEVVALGRGSQVAVEQVAGPVVWRATTYAADDLRQALEGCAALVHLAARRVAVAADGPAPFVTPNVALTGRVLDAAVAVGAGVVCLASSISVYSAANRLPFVEAEPPVPRNPYGASKLAAEELGRRWAAAGGRRVVALRLASLVGDGDGTAPDRMLALFLERARRGEPLVLWGNGGGGRDLLYVRDAARAVAAALAPQAPGGVFNIGSGRPHSFREVAETVNAVFDNPGGVQYDRSRSEDATVAYMDCRRAAAHLAWAPRWDLRSALEDLKQAEAAGRGGA